MKINPVPRKSLAETVAGKISAAILGGSYLPDDQLPSERELMRQMEISRSTVREALKILEENGLIEGRPGVGWFVLVIDEKNYTAAYDLAGEERQPAPGSPESSDKIRISGPTRLPVTPEKPIRIPNLQKDRLGTFEFISWWDREVVENARVLVVGAGALGNEVIKNLVLMGVGHIYVIDFDTIEAANLSRSPLFRESDAGRNKAEVAALDTIS